MQFQHEKLVDIIEEMYPMLVDHFKEAEDGVVEDKEYRLNVDWSTYKRLEDIGVLYVLTVRDNGKLVGYNWYVVHPSLHMMDCNTAHEDIHYLLPSHRKGWTAVKMFKFAEQFLKSKGANRIMIGVKVKGNRDKLFKYLGYEVTEKLFMKGL